MYVHTIQTSPYGTVKYLLLCAVLYIRYKLRHTAPWSTSCCVQCCIFFFLSMRPINMLGLPISPTHLAKFFWQNKRFYIALEAQENKRFYIALEAQDSSYTSKWLNFSYSCRYEQHKFQEMCTPAEIRFRKFRLNVLLLLLLVITFSRLIFNPACGQNL